LKAMSRAIERFCQKHRKFGIPRLMLYVVIISAVVYLINMMDTTKDKEFLLFVAFSPSRILKGEVWRLISWIFFPSLGNSGILDKVFFALALYFYYFIGSTLEREWGTAKFTVYYGLGVLLNIIFGFVFWFVMPKAIYDAMGGYIFITVHYINLSLFFAFATLFPDHKIQLFFFIPIKIKWLALLDAALFAFDIVKSLIAGDIIMAILPIVAILNYIIICGYDLRRYIRPRRLRHAANTINFKTAARQARRENESRNYRHKCAVCARTDADHPDLEFRYCSRCNGYHCFCSDHINNHVHFQ